MTSTSSTTFPLPRPSRSLRRARQTLLGLLFAVAATPTVFAADASAPANDARARYERERAVCMDGRSNQDRATCLKEAGAALDESRRGELARDDGGYRKNALARCKALPAKDQPDCVARIEGDSTTTSGSARDGGILRERVTIEPAPAK